MHEDNCAAELRDRGEHFPIHSAGGDVVDDVCARFDGGGGDRGAVGVN